METIIELSHNEVEKIIADHIKQLLDHFASGKDIYVSGNHYSVLSAKVTIVDPVYSKDEAA